MKFQTLILIGAITLASTNLHAATEHHDVVERMDMSSTVLHSIVETPDKGIPEEVLSAAKCIVVVPHLVKGAFIFGGQHGRGVASCRTENGGWSAPAFVSISGGSWGLQIGVEGIDLVMVVMNDHGLQHMLSDKFQIGGDASASAGPVGRHAAANTDWTLNTELLTYSRSRGAFVGISLEGAWIEQDNDATEAIYGRDHTFRSILSGRVAAPASTDRFMHSIYETSHTSAVAEGKTGN